MYNCEEFCNQCEDRAEAEKRRDQLKKDIGCLDQVAHFPGQDAGRAAKSRISAGWEENTRREAVGSEDQTWIQMDRKQQAVEDKNREHERKKVKNKKWKSSHKCTGEGCSSVRSRQRKLINCNDKKGQITRSGRWRTCGNDQGRRRPSEYGSGFQRQRARGYPSEASPRVREKPQRFEAHTEMLQAQMPVAVREWHAQKPFWLRPCLARHPIVIFTWVSLCWFVVSLACVWVLILCGVWCVRIMSLAAIFLWMSGTDGYQSQKQGMSGA